MAIPGYIADTNIVSNPTAGSSPVAEWLQRYAGLVYLSAITVAEMRRGLALLEQTAARDKDPRVRARNLDRLAFKTAWYRELTDSFADRILPIDVAVADKWAEISVRFPSLRDGDKVIAATALVKGYAVATRNLGDFRALGVLLVNPFDPDSWDDDYSRDPILRLL
ncbi:PIN domain-containing protein [Azospirillum thermophilum]|uniref:VapC toxin family PIN domain ribonuclease n=1 Tax=Azospirillum thermophilum TaxID=2202148 RepID=A0A2S2CLI1_9PROT|nr:PIN domain-containing protein [Azospirillum thermophilum]AWK85230.1 VapC toxin family PIN domain ribonuclease [Azospirillum thermophilum]